MAIVALLALLTLLLLLGTTLANLSTNGARQARRDETRAAVFHLSEAGLQRLLLELWVPFRNDERFDWHDERLLGASAASPRARQTFHVNTAARTRFSAFVTGYATVNNYTRDFVLRSTGWIDLNNGGGDRPDAGEPRATQELKIRLTLKQARVFDYAYFANNYGWMTGFNASSLHVNGDVRANGDFNTMAEP